MYKGYRVLDDISNEEWNLLYQQGIAPDEVDDMIENEYLIVKDAEVESDQGVDRFVMRDGRLHQVPYPIIENRFTGTIKPLNDQQYCAMDMLKNRDIKVKLISGTHGRGKDMLMLNTALEKISSGEYQRLFYVRNNIDVADTTPLGALPGDKDQKLQPFVAPLADHVGGWDGLEQMIYNGTIEVEHLGFLRGRDLKDTIVYVTEAENLTKEHAQLLLGRIGRGSSLWMNGDYRQTDREIFKRNSGMKVMIEALKGNSLFGYVDMPISERSEVAALADELDRYASKK